MIQRDIEIVKEILPDHYTVKESLTKGSIHCKSGIGIRKPPYVGRNGKIIDDAEDESEWDSIFNTIKNCFGDRFQEVSHNTCAWHIDFTIYLKKLSSEAEDKRCDTTKPLS